MYTTPTGLQSKPRFIAGGAHLQPGDAAATLLPSGSKLEVEECSNISDISYGDKRKKAVPMNFIPQSSEMTSRNVTKKFTVGSTTGVRGQFTTAGVAKKENSKNAAYLTVNRVSNG